MLKSEGFKDYQPKDIRVPISCRVPIPARETLKKAAKKSGMTLAHLCAQILEDYAHWLENRGTPIG